MITRLLSSLALLVFFMAAPGWGFSLADPEQRGLALNLGHSYDPDPGFGFAQLSVMALYDYEQIFPHRAPEPLRFKLEGNIGLADKQGGRLLASGNFFALYYLPFLSDTVLRPYVEGGVGLVYSDFQVKDQGLRINFNPQVGIGTEWRDGEGNSWYGAVRLYHLSNSHLQHDNRGINAALLQVGRMF